MMRFVGTGAALLVTLVIWSCLAVVAGKADKCKACRTLVTSFNKGVADTEKSNFGGGNTAWEEKSLGAWATSETRLMEIMEGVCGRKDYSCYDLVEEGEEHIEHWWSHRSEDAVSDSLEEYFCVDTMEVCCMSGHYGKKCKVCPGGNETPCAGHGSCDGDGTRKGSGKCKCSDGYTGKTCEDCTDGYFKMGSPVDDRLICQKCDEECETCKSPGAMCEKCAEGFEKDEEQTCVDVDECAKDAYDCEDSEYCHNTPGGYECRSCHKACKADAGCSGEGPASCQECADGFTKQEDTCIDVNECELEDTKCEGHQYCFNTQGSFNCKDCDGTCVAEAGCTGPGSSGCNECKEGYEKKPAGCMDINECAESSPCSGEEMCTNTVGSYKCECVAPNAVVDGVCSKPLAEDVAAAAAAAETDTPKDPADL